MRNDPPFGERRQLIARDKLISPKPEFLHVWKPCQVLNGSGGRPIVNRYDTHLRKDLQLPEYRWRDPPVIDDAKLDQIVELIEKVYVLHCQLLVVSSRFERNVDPVSLYIDDVAKFAEA